MAPLRNTSEAVAGCGIFNAVFGVGTAESAGVGTAASAGVGGAIGWPTLDTFVAAPPSSRRCKRSTCSSSNFCCSSILRSSSRTTAFSALTASISSFRSFDFASAATLFSESPVLRAEAASLSGGVAGDCPKAEVVNNATDVNASTTEECDVCAMSRHVNRPPEAMGK